MFNFDCGRKYVFIFISVVMLLICICSVFPFLHILYIMPKDKLQLTQCLRSYLHEFGSDTLSYDMTHLFFLANVVKLR